MKGSTPTFYNHNDQMISRVATYEEVCNVVCTRIIIIIIIRLLRKPDVFLFNLESKLNIAL